MRIAVLGGGNGSFAAAGDFALAGHDVRLWRRDTAGVAAHHAAGHQQAHNVACVLFHGVLLMFI